MKLKVDKKKQGYQRFNLWLCAFIATCLGFLPKEIFSAEIKSRP